MCPGITAKKKNKIKTECKAANTNPFRRTFLKLKDKDNNSTLVYSTGLGRMCPSCGKQSDTCTCKKEKNNPAKADGNVRVERSTKGRKGKGVCLIKGIPFEDAQLNALAKQLKQLCGTGGTIKNSVIEIQGDHREMLVKELNKLGYNAKKAGG